MPTGMGKMALLEGASAQLEPELLSRGYHRAQGLQGELGYFREEQTTHETSQAVWEPA